MIRIEDELSRTRQTLELTDSQFRRLPLQEGQAIIREAEARFVLSKGRTWWWEDLRAPSSSRQFAEGDGWQKLVDLAPSISATVWFVAAADDWPVYESTVATVQRILGECYGFEFYLVSHDYEWLIGENHHDFLFASGEPVATTLENWSD